jgi:hypothetical protein
LEPGINVFLAIDGKVVSLLVSGAKAMCSMELNETLVFDESTWAVEGSFEFMQTTKYDWALQREKNYQMLIKNDNGNGNDNRECC